MPHIETERLEMITFTADMMEAILNGTAEQEGKIPYQLALGWPMPVYKQFFAYKIERFRKYPAENEWEGIIVHKQDQRIIGDMGFKGGPNEDGVIDLGYSIVPSYQGKGYATEMGKAMVEWGRSNSAVQKVIATCHPENLASIRVLEKIGFHVTKQTEESIYWEY
ncbi:GNAT family N-acetyltransferase [Mesobacillus maritimus]|uniref:GNAT family N-acetyltransferase n=1 Tax=Mesobacillus maritimus TaxID=1643336 RepID=UPI00203D2DC0|nr:GNAT family N-acetyltransferase [Mesobacillus maritimus]MCM3587442.1 GNAT family N-acetyltransferase [Mesobacillus maritimus]MCM3672178.1 GNAT family N-acetyltransferase [Mesobacillus maritimus]